MNPPRGLSACRSARFDWQGLTLRCQAFPHIGNRRRPSAEVSSHPCDRRETKSRMERIRIYRDESTPTERPLSSYAWKKEGWGVGACPGLCVSCLYNFSCARKLARSPSPGLHCSRTSSFIRLECIRQARSRAQRRKNGSTSVASTAVVLGVCSGPEENAPPQLLVAENDVKGKMLSRRKKKSRLFYDQS